MMKDNQCKAPRKGRNPTEKALLFHDGEFLFECVIICDKDFNGKENHTISFLCLFPLGRGNVRCV